MDKRRRLRRLLGLVLLLLIIAVIAWNRRPSADTVTPTTADQVGSIIDRATQARLVAAGACTKSEYDKNPTGCTIPGIKDDGNIVFDLLEGDILGGKIANQIAQKLARQNQQCLEDTLNGSVAAADSCQGLTLGTINPQPVGDPGVTNDQTSQFQGYLVDVTITAVASETDNNQFGTVYKTSTNDNSGQETIGGSWSASLTLQYKQEYTAYYTNDVAKVFKENIFGRPNIKIVASQGSYQGTYMADVNGTEDLTYNLFDYNNEGFRLDSAKASTWTLQTSGYVNGQINFIWSKGENDQRTSFTLNDYQICPDGCSIEASEHRAVFGNYLVKGQPAGMLADISTTTEERHGSMSVDPQTLAVKWNDDLEIHGTSSEESHSKRTVLPNGLVGEASANIVTKGESFAWPNQNKYEQVSSLTQDLTFSEQDSAAEGEAGSSTKRVVVDIREVVNNQSQTIDGAGSITSNGYTQNGIFDSTDIYRLRLYDANNQLTTYYADPYDGVPDLQLDAYREYPDLPGMMGALTPSNGRGIANRALKLLPAKVLIMNSFSDLDIISSDIFANVQARLAVFAGELRARGVAVEEVRVKSASDMLQALAGVSGEGVWVINIGHGLPTGLAAGDDDVTYEEITAALGDNKLSLFAANSCFSGHAPIADTVFGSVGVGVETLSGNNEGGISTLIGLGGNPFNASFGDVLSALNQILNSCQSGSTGATDTTDAGNNGDTGSNDPADNVPTVAAEPNEPLISPTIVPTNPVINPDRDGDGNGDGTGDNTETSGPTKHLTDWLSRPRDGDTDVLGGMIDAIAADICPSAEALNTDGQGAVCYASLDLMTITNFKNELFDLKQSLDPNSSAYTLVNSLIQAIFDIQSQMGGNDTIDGSAWLATLYAALHDRVNQAETAGFGTASSTATTSSTATVATYTTADFPTELPFDSQPAADFSWYIAPEPFFIDPVSFDPWYEPATEPSAESTDWATAWSELPVLESLPVYAPDPITTANTVVEPSGWESFVTDTFNFAPAPVELVYADPYYGQAFSYAYTPEPEPLFNDWYDYVNPVEYFDYGYEQFAGGVESFVDFVWDEWLS